MVGSKQINIMYGKLRIMLKDSLKDEKNNILAFMSSVETNLYDQEFKIM